MQTANNSLMAEQEQEVKEQEQTQETHLNIQTDFSLGIFGTSDNFKMAWQMSQALAQSTIVPSTFQGNPSNCLIAIEQANRLNMSPFMVIQNLHVIQGRPSWSSKFLIAMINKSGCFDEELHFDETKDKDGKPFSCTAWTTKSGRRVDGITVDMNMAQAEGWLTKNGSKWKTMPQVMLRYRAASFFSSFNCPEITMGIYTQEEAEEIAEKDIYQPNMQTVSNALLPESEVIKGVKKETPETPETPEAPKTGNPAMDALFGE